MDKKEIVLRGLRARKCLKVIAGINNFDKTRVLQIAGAAERAGATCVDICAQPDIVQEVLNSFPRLPVCVSSVVPSELATAMRLGADAVELGNYEALHAEGIFYSEEDILRLTEEIFEYLEEMFPGREGAPLLSVTVPGHLVIGEQVGLAEKLQNIGVDIIQTEGASLVQGKSPGVLGQLEKVKLTLANTMEIAKVLNQNGPKYEVFLLAASGINPDTVPLAMAAGAHGVGVGKYVNKLESDIEILAAISALRIALQNSPVLTRLYT